MLLMFCVILAVMPGQAHAFGAGNIPSIGMIYTRNAREHNAFLRTIADFKLTHSSG